MRPPARGVLSGLAAAVLLTDLVTDSGGASAAVQSPAAAKPAKPTRTAGDAGATTKTVTLITGDRVQVTDLPGGKKGLVVTPAADRKHGVRFLKQTRNSDIVLIPADAAPLVAAGKLDEQLFNLTALIRQRYDDASRTALPLIITGPGTATAASRAVIAGKATVVRSLPSVHGIAVTQPKTGTTELWRSLTAPAGGTSTLAAGIGKVWLDRKVKASLDRSVPQIGAPAAWNAGYTGKGVKVAILDTGVDATHPDLASAVVGAKLFAGTPSGTEDKVGHGTHVASIVAGSGAAAGGKYKGVAPDAKLLNGKVLDDNGEGVYSWIIAGMEWAAEQGAKVANLSLGADGNTAEIDPLEAAVNELTARTGILFAIAAGNSGADGDFSISTPGSAAAALTVGAVDRGDAVTDFSSRGPNVDANIVKPDITAPGLDIVAAKAKGTPYPPIDTHYAKFSGTSMATPHAAGAAAILAEAHPAWKPDALKAALTSSTKPTAKARVFDQGSGRVDLARATSRQVRTSASNVDFGTVPFPHDSTKTKSVTYVNDGTAPVTLTAALTATGPDGKPVTGVFSIGSAQVTVPAGGTANLPVTLKATSTLANGPYSALLTASTADGKTAVQTAVGAYLEEESYDVTINETDRDGKPPAEGGLLAYIRLDGDGARRDAPGQTYGARSAQGYKVRLPKGVYHFTDSMWTPLGGGSNSTTLFAEPDVTVDRDITLTFDARQGKKVDFRPERTGLKQNVPCFSVALEAGDEFEDNGLCLIDADLSTDPFYAVPSRTAKDKESLSFHYNDVWLGAEAKSTVKVKLQEYTAGRIPTELARQVPDSDLGGLDEQFFRQGSAPHAERRDFASVPHEYSATDVAPSVATPGTMTMLASVLPGVSYNHYLAMTPDEVLSATLGVEARVYRKGERRKEKWYQAVNGPVFHDQDLLFSRQGDEIGGFIPFSGDPADHLYEPSEIPGQREPKTFNLYREGALIGTKTSLDDVEFTVPPAAANYKLVVTSAGTLPWRSLSTSVRCEFGFRSAHVGGAGLVYTPLQVVRYTPPVDQNNQAAAGSTIKIPVSVQRQPRSAPAKVKSLAVQASYDDGKTWVNASLEPQGTGQVAVLKHPALGQTNGYVALRGVATDTSGNSVTQTIIRAYRLK